MAGTGPLAGTKVLDLSRLLPGPFATRMLVELGATVDKVEDPGPGDYLRHMPPDSDGMGALFIALNQGKRSTVIDLKSDEGRSTFRGLVGRYDVIVESFRPGVLAKLGLAPASLLAHVPHLIVCSLSGYGQSGPLALRAGHDLNYLARGGVLGVAGPAGQPPANPPVQIADVGGALFASVAIVAALLERQRTGRGKLLDISMYQSAMGFAVAAFAARSTGESIERGGDVLGGGIAPYRTYLTKDGGAVALASLEPKFWSGFCAAIGIEPDMTALIPGEHQAAITARLEALFAQRTRAEWIEFAERHDVCLEPVLTPLEAMGDPHALAAGIFGGATGPEGLRAWKSPLATNFGGGDFDGPAPRQGEHDQAIRSGA
jgi:alpha-methylacyl-CoA racemase